MPGILLIGYDVEGLVEEVRERWGDAYPDPEAVTSAFLRRAADVHHSYGAPCTLFVLGRVLEQNLQHFQQLAGDDIFDIQQHTYSHIRLKTVVEQYDDVTNVYRSGNLFEIEQDIMKASRLLSQYLDASCVGLSAPYGYYRGLSDKPEVLEIIRDAGILYVRAYSRNEHDWGPVALDVQPFAYTAQGFPRILELPGQDWQDCHYREVYGWTNIDRYVSHLQSTLDYVAARNLTWSICLHDFSSIRDDAKMSIVCRMIEHAQRSHIRIMSCTEYYREYIAQ